jgi:hypothetical protein
MSPPDDHEGDADAARRALVIDLDELCWALTSHDPLGQRCSHRLNLRHARVKVVVASFMQPTAAGRRPRAA